MRAGGQWVHFDDVYAMEASQLRRYEELVDELNRAKYC
jgi:hypothetical protein